MSTTDGSSRPKAPRAARAEASVWIVRLHSEARTPELEAGLREWLAADPEHARQFEQVTDVWDLGGAIPASELPRVRTPAPKMRWALGAAAGAVLCVMAFGLAYWWWAASAFVTHHGEQRLVRLEDGSRVYLNTESRLRVEFGATERRVYLERGEGLFEVAKDVARPFIVQARDRRVTAVGTTFVVRVESNRTSVLLIEGKVAVSSENFTLAPGKRVTLSKDSAPAFDSPRVEVVTAWRRGEVLLESTPLAEAVAEMNRYDERQIVLDQRELDRIPVSGIYRTGDSVGFARAVAELQGLRVIETSDDIHIRSR